MQLHIKEDSIDCKNIKELAEYFQIKHQTIIHKTDKSLTKHEFTSKAIQGKVPLLEIEKGKNLNSYHAIVKFLCSKSDSSLLGSSDYEKILFDEFSEMVSSIEREVEKVEISLLVSSMPLKSDEIELISLKISKQFSKFNEILRFSTFLGGNQISWVDFLLFFVVKKAKHTCGLKNITVDLNNIHRFIKFLEETGFNSC